jgi:nucleotide-binding universal stress UspA family protein
MPELRRILCAVDFSDPSNHALAFARELATQFGAELHAVHAFQLPIYALPDGAVMLGPEFATKLMSELQKAFSNLTKNDPAVRTHLVEGIPHREIVRLAAELPADLIVMGTHGHTGFKHLLLGSVAERVVRTASVPVITVPARESRT